MRFSCRRSSRQPAAIEDVFRIEAVADAFAQGGEAGLLGMKHIDIESYLLGGAQQCRVAADGIDALTHQGGLGVRLGWQRRPDQPAAPIIEHRAAGIARQRLAERTARSRRANYAPHWPHSERAIGRERLN